ncbi:MAG: peroxiredoxin [Actinomycetota bacterium]|nr:peroxiredoxin [Actinomycetota bacterium]
MTAIEEQARVARVALPRLNEPAPDFEAVTTHGVVRLSDFAGSWLVLFSHPADFTPVCTTEFMAFAEVHSALQQRHAQLLGLSIDSVYSHIAWVRNIEEKTGVKIPFPIIADLDRKVATAYGMIMPGESQTEASRCVFVIDPDGVLRAMIYYPLTTGRNMDEILRLVDALQMADANHVATPANWRPGDKVIIPTPPTVEVAAERVSADFARSTEGLECVDWYLCKKPVEAVAHGVRAP